MSRVGHGIDHCPVEGFWGIVKTEMYSRNKFSSGDEVRSAIEQYIPFLQLRTFSGTIWSKDANGIRIAVLNAKIPKQFPIAENKRIQKYKAKFAA